MKKLLPAALACCLFLLALGAKWAVFDRYGSAMPDWDQWDAEAVELLIPWFEGDHFRSHLFAPHNEHRVVVTKLQALALTLANGQWDSRLLAVVNAILHSAIGAALWLTVRRWVAARWQLALFVLTAALFALPFAWQNILGGFHSQQYWLIGLSLAAMLAWPFAERWTLRWWLAALAAAVALLTMGSGLLAPAIVVAVLVWRVTRREHTWREVRPTVILAAALVVAGLWLRVEVPGHSGIKAQSVHDFVFTILRSLEWPLREQDWAGLVLWLPWALVLWAVLARRVTADTRGPQLIAALGGWVVLQVLATAYARGLGGEYPASRYMDTLAVGTLANGAALAWLAERPAVRGAWRRPFVALAAAWLVLVAAGLHRQTVETFHDHLPGAKSYYGRAESFLRGFLATDDPAHLAFPDIPYPSVEGLMERLRNPHLRPLMPAVVRAPLPLRPARASKSNAAPVPDEWRGTPAECFLQNEHLSLGPEIKSRDGLSPATPPLDFAKTWGSYGRTGTALVGEWRSSPIAATLDGWLKFETAGHVGEPGVTLELRDAATGRFLAAVKPTKTPGDAWRAAYVRSPGGPFVVVAHDRDPSRWMAFSAPVEVGPLSHAAWRVSKHGMLILGLAAAAATGLVLATAWPRRGPG